MGFDIITPGTSTVDYIQDLDTESLQDFSVSQTQRQINAFNMSWIIVPPKPALHRYVFRFHHAPHGVSCLFIFFTRTRLDSI